MGKAWMMMINWLWCYGLLLVVFSWRKEIICRTYYCIWSRIAVPKLSTQAPYVPMLHIFSFWVKVKAKPLWFFFFFDIGPLIFLNYLLRDDDDLPFLPESRVMVYPRLFYLQLHYNGEAILQPFLQERRGNQGLGFCLLCLVIKGWSESLSSFWIVILFLLSQFFHIFWR